MSEKEVEIIEKMAETLPNMSTYQKAYMEGLLDGVKTRQQDIKKTKDPKQEV